MIAGYFYDDDIPGSSTTRTEEKIEQPAIENSLPTPSQEEIRSKRLAFLSKLESNSNKCDNAQQESEKCNGCDQANKTPETNGPQTNGIIHTCFLKL